MRLNNTKIIYSVLYLVSILLSACGGGGGGAALASYTVGGTVSGLTGSVVLQDNGNDNLTVSTNSNFTFATTIANGNTYNVTVLTQPTGQTCTVSGGTGTISGNVTNVAVTCAITYTIGGTVSGLNGSMMLQNNGVDNLTVSINGSFTFPTAVAYGNPYSVTKLSQQFPNQTCTITGGSGSATAIVNNVAVNCIKHTIPRFAYVANYSDNTVSAYTINASTGVLTPVGAAVTAGSNPRSVSADPSGKFAYVANNLSSDISAYTINAMTGALTSIGTVAAGYSPASVTVDPSGKFAYVAHFSGVSAYTINTTTGVLTSVGTVAAGYSPASVTVDPSGRFAYVANSGSYNVSAYTINATTGALTSIGPDVAARTYSLSVTVGPSGKFAYVANSGGNVSIYTINASTGALTPVSAAVATGGSYPTSVTVDPSGKFAYVANCASNDVSAHTITSSGVLAAVRCTAGTPGCSLSGNFQAGSCPLFVTTDPSGKFAYVANRDSHDISAYTINATTGALTSIGPAMASVNPYSIATTTGTIQ